MVTKSFHYHKPTPKYFSFIHSMVISKDLFLNLSWEMLQKKPGLESHLQEYCQKAGRRQQILWSVLQPSRAWILWDSTGCCWLGAAMLLYVWSGDRMTFLSEYVSLMKELQKPICSNIHESQGQVASSAFVEPEGYRVGYDWAWWWALYAQFE